MRSNQSVKALICLTALSCLLTVTNPAIAGPDDSYPVQKSKIIRFIAGEVEWPQGSIQDAIVNVCLLGTFQDEEGLSKLNGKSAKHHTLHVRHVSSPSEATTQCQIVYVSKSEANRISEILTTFATKPVLLLGDMDQFALKGGSMNFMELNSVIALTINFDSLRTNNLQFSLKDFDQITVIPEKNDLIY